MSKGEENSTRKVVESCDENKKSENITNIVNQKEDKSKVENLITNLGLRDSGSSDDDFDPETLLKQKQSISATIEGNKGDIDNDKITSSRLNRSRIIDSDDEDNACKTVSFSSVDKNRSALDSDSSSDSDLDVEKLLAQKTAMAFVNKSSISSSDSETVCKEDDSKTKKRKAFQEIANKVKKRKEMEKEKELFINNSSDKSVNGYSTSELEKIRSSLDEDLVLTESEDETNAKDYSKEKETKIAEIALSDHIIINSNSTTNEDSEIFKNNQILSKKSLEFQEESDNYHQKNISMSPVNNHIGLHNDSQPTEHKTIESSNFTSNCEDFSTKSVLSSNSLSDCKSDDKTPELRKNNPRPKFDIRDSYSDYKKQNFDYRTTKFNR